jgi:hypothetical protein
MRLVVARCEVRYTARLIASLCADDARWITGRVIVSEGGFHRWAS